MKLHILSDLHIEFAPYSVVDTDADVIILAGDIGLPDLVTKCPECLIGRAVAITSFDSGPLVRIDKDVSLMDVV